MKTKEQLIKQCEDVIYRTQEFNNTEAYVVLYRLLKGQTIEQAFTESPNTDNEYCALSNVCRNYCPCICDESCYFEVGDIQPKYIIRYNSIYHDFDVMEDKTRLGVFQSYKDAENYIKSIKK